MTEEEEKLVMQFLITSIEIIDAARRETHQKYPELFSTAPSEAPAVQSKN